MTTLAAAGHRAPSRTHMVYTVAIIGFIFSLHMVLPMYSNSSFLSVYMDQRTLGLTYMVGAAISILGYLVAPDVIRRIGNYKTAVILILAQMLLFWGLVSVTDPLWLAAIFALQSAAVALIGLAMDIFLEVYTSSTHVGAIRGLYTATLNASWVIGPLLGSMLIGAQNDFRNTYIASFAMLFPLLYLIYRNFPRFADPNYIHLSPWQLVRHVSHNKSWVALFVANFMLQVFYAWMVVYSPLYLSRVMGFSWESIGIIFTVMLVAFPLVQYPLGKIADRRYGEKEIMIAGFAVMAVATVAMSFISSREVAVWAIAFFATRLGAAAAEIMIETYFFKTTSPRDTEALGLFRVTRPLAYFVAPIVAGASMMFAANEYSFFTIGLVTLLAVIPAALIKDTN